MTMGSEVSMSNKTRSRRSNEARPSEDDLARASLGGTKGSPELPDAPLTKKEKEQTLPNDEPEHVA
jgi:hypothetical protein